MKPAAEEATEIILHYLRHAGSSVNLDDPDVFAEIEGVMQGLIDEAVTRAVADVLSRGLQHVNVVNVHNDGLTPREVPDAPAPPGPRPYVLHEQGENKQAPAIAGVMQLLPGPMCLHRGSEELEHMSSDQLSHVYNCKFCEQILKTERGE